MSFETIFIGSGSTGITQSPSGKPLTDFCGFLYYIMGSGANGTSITTDSGPGAVINGGSGTVNSGYIDFNYPYNVDLSTLNVNIGNNTSITFQYTNDPSNFSNPYPSGYDGSQTYTISKGTVNIQADQPYSFSEITNGTYLAPDISLSSAEGYYAGGVYTYTGYTEPTNNTVTDQQNNTQEIEVQAEGTVVKFTGLDYANLGGGFYGGVTEGRTSGSSRFGPFGRGSGGTCILDTPNNGTFGFAVLTLIPNSAIGITGFIAADTRIQGVANNNGDYYVWDTPSNEETITNISGLCLYGLAAGGGGGAYKRIEGATNAGAGGGGGGFLSCGMFYNSSNYNCVAHAGAGGYSIGGGGSGDITQNGNAGENTVITFKDLSDNIIEQIECMGGQGGSASTEYHDDSINGDGGDGYYGGGAGVGGEGTMDNFAFGGESQINIPSYNGANQSSTHDKGGDGAGSINSSCFGVGGTNGASSTAAFGGGGGGGLWGGNGAASGSGSTPNQWSSALGYASGGGGGGFDDGTGYPGGGGSGGYVILKQLNSNNFYFTKLTSNTTLSLAQFVTYKGLWIFTDNFDTTAVSISSLNTFHFLIKEDGLISVVYNSTTKELTLNFKKLSVNGTNYLQNITLKASNIANLAKASYFKLFFYE